MDTETYQRYERETYTGLLRHEVIAPAIKNDGSLSGYPDALGQALIDAGLNWTAVETVGAWNGKVEPGRQFTIFAPEVGEAVNPRDGIPIIVSIAPFIGDIARSIMPDQQAIQVVVDQPVNLIEA